MHCCTYMALTHHALLYVHGTDTPCVAVRTWHWHTMPCCTWHSHIMHCYAWHWHIMRCCTWHSHTMYMTLAPQLALLSLTRVQQRWLNAGCTLLSPTKVPSMSPGRLAPLLECVVYTHTWHLLTACKWTLPCYVSHICLLSSVIFLLVLPLCRNLLFSIIIFNIIALSIQSLVPFYFLFTSSQMYSTVLPHHSAVGIACRRALAALHKNAITVQTISTDRSIETAKLPCS